VQRETGKRVWLGTLISAATLSIQALGLHHYITAIFTALTGSLVALIFYWTLLIPQMQNDKTHKSRKPYRKQQGASRQKRKR